MEGNERHLFQLLYALITPCIFTFKFAYFSFIYILLKQLVGNIKLKHIKNQLDKLNSLFKLPLISFLINFVAVVAADLNRVHTI